MSALLKPAHIEEDPVAVHVRGILEHLGDDLRRGGLVDTPARYAKALRELTSGYAADVESVVGNGVFPAEGHGPIVIRDIGFHPLCAHHVLPFHGRVHVGYVPGRTIIGLSKIPRIVEVFARRLQVQERITEQVADALVKVLAPKAVVVVVEAQHLCMAMRGVRKAGSSTLTRAARGDSAELVEMVQGD